MKKIKISKCQFMVISIFSIIIAANIVSAESPSAPPTPTIIGIIIPSIGTAISPSTEASNINDDVEIKISAGRFGLNIGTELRVDVIINKNENVTVFYNMSSNYLFTNFRDETISHKSTYEGKGNYSSFYFKYFLGFGIDLFSITVECEDTSVTRNGIWIGIRLCILFK